MIIILWKLRWSTHFFYEVICFCFYLLSKKEKNISLSGVQQNPVLKMYTSYIPVNYDIILLLEICNYLTSVYYILFIYFKKEKFLILVYGLILTAQNDLQNKNNYYVWTTSPISVECCVSYRNQSSALLCKTNGSFLYETQHSAERNATPGLLPINSQNISFQCHAEMVPYLPAQCSWSKYLIGMVIHSVVRWQKRNGSY